MLAIGAAALILAAGVSAGGVLLWRRQVRGSLVGLVARREAVHASYHALETMFATLTQASPDELIAFATERANPEMRALEELRGRMAIEMEELQSARLPKTAWHAADLLVAAAQRLRDEVSPIIGASGPEAVVDAVAALDVATMRAAIAEADAEIDRLLRENKVEDPSVYGGGMYI